MSSNKRKDNNSNSFLGNKTNHPEEINDQNLLVCHICNKEKEKCFICSKCKSNYCTSCIEEILKDKEEQIEEIKKKNDNNSWICLMCEKICPCEKCNFIDNKCLVCKNICKNIEDINEKIKKLNLDKNEIEKLKNLEIEEIKAVLENFEKNEKIYVCEKCLLNNKNIKNLLDNKLNLLFSNNNNKNIENNNIKEDEIKNKEKNIFNILDNDIKLNKNDINNNINNENKMNANNNNILNKFDNQNFLFNQIVTPEINNINVTKNLSSNSIPKDFTFPPMFQTENIIQNSQLNNNLDNNINNENNNQSKPNNLFLNMNNNINNNNNSPNTTRTNSNNSQNINNSQDLISSFNKITNSLQNFNEYNLQNNFNVLNNINTLSNILTLINQTKSNENEKDKENNENNILNFCFGVIEDLKKQINIIQHYTQQQRYFIENIIKYLSIFMEQVTNQQQFLNNESKKNIIQNQMNQNLFNIPNVNNLNPNLALMNFLKQNNNLFPFNSNPPIISNLPLPNIPPTSNPVFNSGLNGLINDQNLNDKNKNKGTIQTNQIPFILNTPPNLSINPQNFNPLNGTLDPFNSQIKPHFLGRNQNNLMLNSIGNPNLLNLAQIPLSNFGTIPTNFNQNNNNLMFNSNPNNNNNDLNKNFTNMNNINNN